MGKFFKVKLEFDKSIVDSVIEDTIKTNGKGYVCSVEGNSLANAHLNKKYLDIINNSLINICDGGSIAFLASLIHLKKYTTYIGADLFLSYSKHKKYRYYFLGNNIECLNGLKDYLSQFNAEIQNMTFKPLPYARLEDFNYQEIANMINQDNPDIIWVSLGAPKQEEFMHRLLPYLNRGIMFGFGAIFDFYSGISKIKRAPKIFLLLKIEWLFRLFLEPKKQGRRISKYLGVLPKIIISELQSKVTYKESA